MVVKLGNALVARVAVLGAQRPTDDARRTELVKVERLSLGKLKDCLQRKVPMGVVIWQRAEGKEVPWGRTELPNRLVQGRQCRDLDWIQLRL